MAFLIFIGILMPHSSHAVESLPEDKTAARILAYFTVGRDDAPNTNVTIEQFQSHLSALKSGGYNVLPLSDITAAYSKKKTLPLKTVAITFDGGDKTILNNATTLLSKHNFPYTVFIAIDRVNENSKSYLNWQDIKNLQKSKLVSFGLHPENYNLNHSYKTKKQEKEIRLDINNATYQFRQHLGYQPILFSYVHGAYNQTYKDIISSYGFEGAVGQQSGVAYSGSDIFALPRFVMTEDYANIERFKMVVDALPLPVSDITPSVTAINTSMPAIGFTASPTLSNALDKLRCFASGQTSPKVNIIGGERCELRLTEKIKTERFRVNCTLPINNHDDIEPQKWRWFGLLLTQ